MASQPNITRLISLLGGNPGLIDFRPDQLVELEWLENPLGKWIDSQNELFDIALEKEEKDTYRKAVEAHLLDADEIVSINNRQIEGYYRPSIMREALQSIENFDPQELPNLKRRRKTLRASLIKRTKRLEMKTALLQTLNQRVEEQKAKLVGLSPVSDDIISKCAENCLQLITPVLSEIGNSDKDGVLLKDISQTLKSQYQDMSKTSFKSDESGMDPASLNRQFSTLNCAIENVEDALYQEELQHILEELENGVTWESLVANEEHHSSTTSEVLASVLQSAWQRDESDRISYQESILLKSKRLLESRIAPPVLLLYEGLSALQGYIIEVHAQCDALITELANFAVNLLSEVEGSEISEE